MLGADTIIFLDGRVYGKPHDAQESKAMLKALAGREHEVATGIAWVRENGGSSRMSRRQRVFFAPMTDEAIAAYVETEEPLDKAGAYAIQGRAARSSSASRLQARSPTSSACLSTRSAGLPEGRRESL